MQGREMADAASKLTGLAAVLHVKDMQTSVAFYRDSLGFAVSFSWEDPPRYVCLCRDGVAIHLNSYVPPDGTAHVCIFCTGIDALYAKFVASGVNMAEPIKNQSYGMRDFVVTDPDGHRLVFGQGTSEH
jgi:uncharacterized glyoxalase superfamily protein PhnB